MPIKIPDTLPAYEQLTKENVFLMPESRADHQDIRPLKILILNLMPLKIETETHLLRTLSNTPLQVEIDFIHTLSHKSKNTPKEHLDAFYKTFEDIKDHKYDGMIITGAPVENLNFEEVNYWGEIVAIMDWSKTHVTSTLHICWAAQAGLYHHYNIQKQPIGKKMFGIFEHTSNIPTEPLLRGFDDVYYAPHSRYTEIKREDIIINKDLILLSESKEAGVYIIKSIDDKQIFVTGHSEYDPYTLKREYERDIEKGIDIEIPKNYFPDNNPQNDPLVNWRSHANLLYSNWLNYYVYQITPYNLEDIK